jgi:threonine aldolase
VHPYLLQNRPDGSLDLEEIREAIRGEDSHYPRSRLVVLENTHNRCGGKVLGVDYCRAVGALAHEYGLFTHLDGARLFNAAVALGVPAAELAAPFDSLTFCLSKALCAPVGSLICGSREFIQRAHRMRKQLGGGMRQAGVLAAAGIVALEQMVERLAEDHRRAQVLASKLGEMPGLLLDMGMPATNMVYLSLSDEVPLSGAQVKEQLAARGIKVGLVGRRSFRLVTHYWIDDVALARTVEAFSGVLGDSSQVI